jgi:SAM-dependent methyltransferase
LTTPSKPERVHHPLFARAYARLAPSAESAGVAEHRDELLAGLRGRVVEIGAGPGLNFAHYPATVSEVVAVEPEPHFRRRAAAARSEVPVHLVAGTAAALPLADQSVDAAVFSLVLCSVGSPAAALAEAVRVLVSGGELRYYEHVRSQDVRAGRRQDRFDRVWPYVAGGCHCSRETESAIAAAGFTVTHVRRFEFEPRGIALPVSPHVIGSAVWRSAQPRLPGRAERTVRPET